MADVSFAKHWISFFLLALVNIEVSNSFGHENYACKQTGNCRCIQLNGNGFDLSPLESYTDQGPRFLAYSNKEVAYFYHPCADLPLQTYNHTECSSGCSLCFFKAQTPSTEKLNIADILSQKINGTFYRLAYANQAVFQPSDVEVDVVFKSENISTDLKLICKSGGESAIYPKDQNTINNTHHVLLLESPYSCFRNLSNDKHMSGAAVFFLILITVAAAYLFGGMLVLRYIKGATGTEMIPNYDFWVSLPGRVKNCVQSLFRGGNYRGDSYETI